MFDTIAHAIPLPLNTSVGEIVRMVIAEMSLAKLMSNKDVTDSDIDKFIDHTIAVVMIIVTKHRQNSKK